MIAIEVELGLTYNSTGVTGGDVCGISSDDIDIDSHSSLTVSTN